ncbi:hypothetical protein [Rhizobium halophilum]|uniref:hypothetical protein n=1 Tax=Rhizobium halophilum TaxID=2846852 RepID=UPI001EFCAF23|nr:hypothetical protein [Rhizobium halophilum]MCF6370965.1 hypothetical protein [Rhizobium halophilum]
MPIIPIRETEEIDPRQLLEYEITEIINDALLSQEDITPLDVTWSILAAVDQSGVFITAPLASADVERAKSENEAAERAGKYLDLDALPKREGERTVADLRKDGGTPEEREIVRSAIRDTKRAMDEQALRGLGLM